MYSLLLWPNKKHSTTRQGEGGKRGKHSLQLDLDNPSKSNKNRYNRRNEVTDNNSFGSNNVIEGNNYIIEGFNPMNWKDDILFFSCANSNNKQNGIWFTII